ncbi:MAG TPA: hypothetical protein VIT65_21735 [Microlunatus sp.]
MHLVRSCAAALPLEDMHGIGRVGYLRDPDGNVYRLISAILSGGIDTTAR